MDDRNPRHEGDAHARWLALVADDITGLLGPDMELHALEIAREEPYVVRCRYALAGVEAVSEGSGASLVEAHADLRNHVVEDRIGVGLRALTQPAR